ncbi:MAG: hypothetical protein WBM59_15140 [Sedimenticolaceae bacterium]
MHRLFKGQSFGEFERVELAVSGGSLFFPKAANEKDGCAAMVSCAENLAERQQPTLNGPFGDLTTSGQIDSH